MKKKKEKHIHTFAMVLPPFAGSHIVCSWASVFFHIYEQLARVFHLTVSFDHFIDHSQLLPQTYPRKVFERNETTNLTFPKTSQGAAPALSHTILVT